MRLFLPAVVFIPFFVIVMYHIVIIIIIILHPVAIYNLKLSMIFSRVLTLHFFIHVLFIFIYLTDFVLSFCFCCIFTVLSVNIVYILTLLQRIACQVITPTDYWFLFFFFTLNSSMNGSRRKLHRNLHKITYECNAVIGHRIKSIYNATTKG